MSAPDFAPPQAWTLDDDVQARLARHIVATYDAGVRARTQWNDRHREYDDMFRGRVAPRDKPWTGAADLHIQMPYWLIDAVNVRLVTSIWEQVPLVTFHTYDSADEDKARDAAAMVTWQMASPRMRARHYWSRLSKIRLTHGLGCALISAGKRGHTQYQLGPDGPVPVDGPEDQHPVMTPLEWDDVVVWPLDSVNLQPRDELNPAGAATVILRRRFLLDQLLELGSMFPYVQDDAEKRERQWWIDRAPNQDRSGENDRRTRRADQHQGIHRSQATPGRATPPDDRDAEVVNPEFEVLYYFGRWHDPDQDRSVEALIFAVRDPEVVLGAFPLAMIHYNGWRPLLELHYQTVGMNIYSMGIPEIVQHLSAELDTIHNMRMDVGFATNMPYFFYADTMALEPSKIVLAPLKGIPVPDPNGIRFPQVANVTSFYQQEELQLFSLIERVVGVTDLFLGISPTRGAAARHATGFVGTQQESLARTSEILNQDAEAFEFLARMVYEITMQYGPSYQAFRLLGKESQAGLGRYKDQLWFDNRYDISLGANHGTYAQSIEQQRAQIIYQMALQNPLVQQSPLRLWEASARWLYAQGEPNPDRYLGPRSAWGAGDPLSQEEEINRMLQGVYGPDQPAPVHPNDDDQDHLLRLSLFLNDPGYVELGTPALQALQAHGQLHQQQQAQKQAMAMQPAAASPGGGPGVSPPPASGSPMGQQDRMMAAMMSQAAQGQPPPDASGPPPNGAAGL